MPKPSTFAGDRDISTRAEWPLLVTPRLLPLGGVAPVQLCTAHTVPAQVPLAQHRILQCRNIPAPCLGLCFRTFQLNKQPRCLPRIVSPIKGRNVLCCCSLQAHKERRSHCSMGDPLLSAGLMQQKRRCCSEGNRRIKRK